MNILILIGVMLASVVVSLSVARSVSRTILIPSSLIVAMVVSRVSFFWVDNNWLAVLVPIASAVFFSAFVFFVKKIKYNFTKRILTLTYLYNILNPVKPSGRIIGRVLPYSNYQLRYNGRFIVADEISAAGATLISGSIGSGKTFGMLQLIKQNIADGSPVIFAEYKGDPDVISKLEAFAKENGYDVYKLSQEKANFNYDPLQRLNNSGRIEAIMNMRKWDLGGSDAHFKTGTQLLLQKTIGLFTHEYNDKKATKEPLGSYTYEFYQFMKKYNYSREEHDAYSTVTKLLELTITSSIGGMFKGENEKTLDFNEIRGTKFIVLVSFVSSNKEIGTSFSSLMFKDLLDEFTLQPSKRNINLYIDEFGTIENPFIVKDLLEKGRSGRIATTLALQDINQIVIQTNESYLKSILGIVNTFIVYSGATRDTAMTLAGVQILEIENVLMNLKKPLNGHGPTAIYISKYPTLNKSNTSEVFRFQPYVIKDKVVEHLSVRSSKLHIGNPGTGVAYIKTEDEPSLHLAQFPSQMGFDVSQIPAQQKFLVLPGEPMKIERKAPEAPESGEESTTVDYSKLI